MSSPATAAFLAAWNRSGRQAATLIKIELTDPTTLTLYLATREVVTPGAPPQVWEPAVADVEPIHEPGALLTSSMSLATGGFTLIDRPLAYQTGTQTLRRAFASHRWIGAAATIYLWELTLADFADALPFRFVIANYEDDAGGMAVHLIQRHDFNREVTPEIVARDKYPRAAEQSIGQSIPIVWGAVRGVAAREPAPAEYGFVQHWLDRIGGGRQVVPGVVVDAGGGGVTPGGKTKIVFASHPCKTFADYMVGCMPYVQVGGRMAMVDPDSGDIFNNATDGTGFQIGDVPSGGIDPFKVCYLPIIPLNVEAKTNNAENPRATLDPYNETSYCRLDYTAGYRELCVRFPSIAPCGDIVHVAMEVAYRSTGSMANVLFTLLNTVTGPAPANGEIGMTPTGSATMIAEGFSTSPATWPWGQAGLPSTPWEFGTCVGRVYFAAAAPGVTLDIFYIGLSVRFRPSREVVGAVSHDRITRRRAVYGRIDPGAGLFGRHVIVQTVEHELQDLTALTSPFFANLEGYADDGSGTCTGVAAALVERAPDIAQHLLLTYGGQTTAQIERGAATFGSLVKARDDLKAWQLGEMIHCLVVTAKTDIIRLLEALAQDSLCWFHLGMDGKLRCVVWKPGVATAFDRTLTKHDLTEPPQLTLEPDAAVIASACVPYGFDWAQNRLLHESMVGPEQSISGHLWRRLRDGQLSVIDTGVGQNNKLDFVASGTFVATLTAGARSGIALAQHVAAQMEAASATGRWSVAYGPEIVAGYNDTIRASDSGGAFTATILPAAYATMEALATAVGAALTAAGADTWSAAYSRTTRKLAIFCSYSIAQILWATGAAAQIRAALTLGYDALADQTQATVAEREREEQRFAIGGNGLAVAIPWETGANGTNAGLKNCAALLGFDASRDSPSQVSHPGVSPKDDGEQVLAAARDAYAASHTSAVPGMTIQDSVTAREIRNRLRIFGSRPRPLVRIVSDDIPDIERGRTIPLAANVDDLKAYGVAGTDASWANKQHMAVEIFRHMGGDSYLTEVVAVDVSA